MYTAGGAGLVVAALDDRGRDDFREPVRLPTLDLFRFGFQLRHLCRGHRSPARGHVLQCAHTFRREVRMLQHITDHCGDTLLVVLVHEALHVFQ
jgi:hypothetical protein